MRSLHICNLANVAYGCCKILRQSGEDVKLICHDLRHVMSQPEWDDLELPASAFPDEWNFSDNTADFGAYRRPSWYHSEDLFRVSPAVVRATKAWLPERLRLRAKSVLAAFRLRFGPYANRSSARGLGAEFGARCARLAEESAAAGPPWTVRRGDLEAFRPNTEWVDRHAAGCEVIFAYVLSPIYAMLLGRLPFVGVEIGTLRDIPFDGTVQGRLLALAYRHTPHLLITNPDTRTQAERLGLRSFSFCPHPVDEEVYAPAATDGAFRRDLLARHRADFLFFAPARQNWALKGNDRYLRAFAELVRRGVNAVLLIPGWGQEVEKSRRLAGDLAAADRIVWLPPQSERMLVRYYQAVDAVLDQFVLGVFGLITPKAMAVGRPVLTSYTPEANAWCFPEPPPVLACSTDKEIADALWSLVQSPQMRGQLGESGRAWILRHHAKPSVVRALHEAADRARENFAAADR